MSSEIIVGKLPSGDFLIEAIDCFAEEYIIVTKAEAEQLYAKLGQVLQDDDFTSKSSDVVYS